MRQGHIPTLLAVLVLVASLVACESKKKGSAEPGPKERTVSPGDFVDYEGPQKPLDTEWLLQSLNGTGAAKGSDIVLDHLGNDGKFELNVEGGCMGFFLIHELEEERIRVVKPGLQTGRLDCGKPKAVQRQAEDILGIMRHLARVRATKDRFELTSASDEVAVFVRPAPAQVDPALAGTEWFLTTLKGKKPPPKPRLTLEIGKEDVGGYSGCNSFGGAVDKMDDGELVWSSGPSDSFASTLVGCGSVTLEKQELAYQNAVHAAEGYRREGERLELLDGSGRTTVVLDQKTRSTFDPVVIEETRWRVRSIDGEAPGGGSVPTVEFGSEGQISWYDGCLQHSGTYRFTDYELEASRRGPMEKECMKPGNPMNPMNFYPGGSYRKQDGLLEVLDEGDGTKTILEPLAGDARLDREGAPWELGAFVENGVTARVVGENQITLTFDRGTLRREGTIYGSTGCNDYRAAYEYPTARNTFERIVVADPVLYPHQCSGLRDLTDEQRFLGILRNLGEHPTISRNGQLTLETKNGRKLIFLAKK